MEPKKNPKYDIHRQRGVLLNVGLMVSLVLVITAFKWKVLAPPIFHRNFELSASDMPMLDDPRITSMKSDRPPKPRSVKPVVPIARDFKESLETSSEDDPTVGPDQESEQIELTPSAFDVPVEILEPDTFLVVEVMPMPVGGWAAFYKTLGSNIKYPSKAARNFAAGKVFVEFVINAKGEPSHFKILKGIGHGCDEEAMRVLSMTKWNPGKQRGRPVNVRLVQPVNFSLSK